MVYEIPDDLTSELIERTIVIWYDMVDKYTMPDTALCLDSKYKLFQI